MGVLCMDWIKNHKKIVLGTVAAIILAAAIFYLYEKMHPAVPVTYETQTDAETPAGLENAADKAKIKLQQDQIEEAAKQIASLKNKQPDTITHTIVQQVPVVVEKERQDSGADFAIVTDPKNPDQKVDLTKYQDTDPVVLNQYNVQAYKKILHTVSYAPKDIQDWSPKEVGYSVAKKITNDGQYIGVGVDYNVDEKKGLVKLEYTW